MAKPLTNNTVASTYEALIKIGNNAPITATLAVLSDGAGNDLPVELSTDTMKITGNLDVTAGIITVATPTQGNHATTKLYVDTEIQDVTTAYEADDAALQTQIDSNDLDITALQNADIAIFGWTLNGLALSDSISIVGSNGIAVSDDSNNTITIDASGVDVGVTSLNGLTGDVTLSAGNNINFDVVGNDIEINSSGGGGGGGSDSFNTFTVPTQPDVVADSGNDTMNFVDGDGISMTTDNTTKTITFDVDGLGNTQLLFNSVWVGDGFNQPNSVLLANLTVGNATDAVSATTATNAVKARVNTVTSGDYRVLLGDTSFGDNDFTDLYADLSGGITYNPAGDILTVGSLGAPNDVTAGGTLSGVTLDISGNADIDGTLTLGGIGNVESEINQNANDIASLQAIIEYSIPITEFASFVIEDNTYVGRYVICNSLNTVEVEFEPSSTWTPSLGDEIYFFQQGTGQVDLISLGVTFQAPNGLTSTRARYSTIAVKYLGSDNWAVMGDLG